MKKYTISTDLDFDIQTGEFEADILCEDCDNKIISQYESYADQVLYGSERELFLSMENFRNSKGVEYIKIKGLDYKKFKLFLLSLLWRASVSKRPFFRAVQLGPHSDNIRQMILDGDPGKPDKYPCAILSYRRHKDVPHQIIMEPKKLYIRKIRSYLFLINGAEYIFRIIENETLSWVLESAVKENSEANILQISEKVAKSTINKFLGVRMFPDIEKGF